MKRVILHIGRHKSGTSSLQKFLSENDILLKENNFIYPINFFYRGYAHHELAELLSRKNTKNLSSVALDDLLSNLAEQINELFQKVDGDVILSSEAFQNCHPLVIKALFERIDCKVEVVCYIREQVGYIASAYNQKVHATGYQGDIYEFFESFQLDYSDFISSWAEAFEQFRIRVFDKRLLLRSDIVCDFLEAILNIRGVTPPKRLNNVSLSRKYLSFKLLMNKDNFSQLDKKERARLYRILANYSEFDKSGSYRLPSGLAAQISEAVSQSNEWVSSHIENGGLKLTGGSSESAEVLTAEEYEGIKSTIMKNIKGS